VPRLGRLKQSLHKNINFPSCGSDKPSLLKHFLRPMPLFLSI
jgi:hypothetical protein